MYKCLNAIKAETYINVWSQFHMPHAYCGCYVELNRDRSSAESYPSCHYGMLEGPALFARRHVPTTFSFPLPVTAQRRYEPAAVLPALPVAGVASALRVLPASTTCGLQSAEIIHDFRRVQVPSCLLVVVLLTRYRT